MMLLHPFSDMRYHQIINIHFNMGLGIGGDIFMYSKYVYGASNIQHD